MRKMLQCIIPFWIADNSFFELTPGPKYGELVTAVAENTIICPMGEFPSWVLEEYPEEPNGYSKSGFRELVDEQEANEYREQMKDFKPVPLMELQPELV